MIELPDTGSVETVADWVELILCAGKDQVSKAELSSTIEGLAGKDPGEAFISSIWRELANRQANYVQPYFNVEDYTIESLPDPRPLTEYKACLLLSLFGVQGSTQVPGKLFEGLVRLAMEKYLSGKAVIFGWPFEEVEEGTDKESAISRKIKKLANDLGEIFYAAPDARYKDRGVDVVGWVPFVDKRSGQIIVLLQCAAGHNWETKLPVPIEAWRQYIHWAFNPIRAFAVPCVINERQWHDMSKDKGLLFDRVRILNLLSSELPENSLSSELKAWVDYQIKEFER